MDNKIKGLLYGAVIGDINGYLAKNPPTETDKANPFKKYDWNSVTDRVIVLMEALCFAPELNVFLFAEKLKDWYDNGLIELGQKTRHITAPLNFVLTKKDYVVNPLKSAKNSYKLMGSDNAKNDSLNCNAICGLSPLWYRNTILHNVVTSYDSRCIAACLVQSYIINCIFWRLPINWKYIYEVCLKIITNHKISKKRNLLEFNNYWHLALSYTQFLKRQQDKTYVDFIKSRNIIDSADSDNQNYCLTGMVLAIVIAIDIQNEIKSGRYPNSEYYRKRIEDTASCLCDSISNCAIIGSIIGIFVGGREIPQDMLSKVNNKDWLDVQIDKFITTFSRLF